MSARTDPDVPVLLDAAARGDVRALARLISVVEAGGPQADDLAGRTFPLAGRAWVVGITGAAGAGKSTLVGALVGQARRADRRVAVLAVDPSSPLTGGAVLGDRVRFQQHATDAGVFVRSMASRGRQGGLSRATIGAIRLLDAAGWPLVVVETVGAGQAEVDVASVADTTVVVVTPGWGDALQVAKAGLMEVADVFVVNKADRSGVDLAVHHLEASLRIGPEPQWMPPVVRTVATTGQGAGELWAAIDRHRAHQQLAGRRAERRQAQVAAEVRRLVADTAAAGAASRCAGPDFDRLVAEVAQGRLDPTAAAAVLLAGES